MYNHAVLICQTNFAIYKGLGDNGIFPVASLDDGIAQSIEIS